VARLPFIIEPKAQTHIIGTPATGTLAIKVVGDLTPAELLTIQALESGSNLFQMASALAVKISDAEAIPLMKAYNFVNQAAVDGPIEDDMQVHKVRYADGLAALSAVILDRVSTNQLATVTAILKHRVNSEWGLQDTAELPSRLVQAIYDFAVLEQAGAVPDSPVTEAQVKKQPTPRRRSSPA